MADKFKVLREGVAAGLSRVASTVDAPSKPTDVDYYNQLKPEDFTRIVDRFGQDATLAYIQQMEVARLKRRK